MENTTPGDKFPLLERSCKGRLPRTISYGIYETDSRLYPEYKYVLLKYISFPPSTVIQRDEGFAILLNDVEKIASQIRRQGFDMFARHPSDPPGLICSFM